MDKGAGVCVCFVLLIGNLEKKPKKFEILEMGGGKEEETRKGHCLPTKMSRFQERVGLLVLSPPQPIFYF